MIDDNIIEQIVKNYIEHNLERDYKHRLSKVSFEDYPEKPAIKYPKVARKILQDYQNDLSNFNVSSVKTLASEICLDQGEDLDLDNLLHKKLSLELLRAQVSIYKEILARNQGNWNIDRSTKLSQDQAKRIPSILESIELYFKRYDRSSKAREADKKGMHAFLVKILAPLLQELIQDLSLLDEEVLFDLQELIVKLPKRSGRNSNLDITKWYKGEIDQESYEIISATQANKFIKIIRAYLKFIEEKGFIEDKLSTLLRSLDTNAAHTQRVHFEKNEVKKLIEVSEDLELLPKVLAYSGMRLSEFFKAKIDIDPDSNIPYFDLTDSSISLKNKNSYRVIPLHRHLESIDENELERLQSQFSFRPELASRAMNKLINIHIAEDKQKTLHSLRHSFSTFLKRANVSESYVAELMGHSRGSTMSFGRYAGNFALGELKNIIDLLDYS
jgi:integrase